MTRVICQLKKVKFDKAPIKTPRNWFRFSSKSSRQTTDEKIRRNKRQSVPISCDVLATCQTRQPRRVLAQAIANLLVDTPPLMSKTLEE